MPDRIEFPSSVDPNAWRWILAGCVLAVPAVMLGYRNYGGFVVHREPESFGTSLAFGAGTLVVLMGIYLWARPRANSTLERDVLTQRRPFRTRSITLADADCVYVDGVDDGSVWLGVENGSLRVSVPIVECFDFDRYALGTTEVEAIAARLRAIGERGTIPAIYWNDRETAATAPLVPLPDQRFDLLASYWALRDIAEGRERSAAGMKIPPPYGPAEAAPEPADPEVFRGHPVRRARESGDL